MLQKPQTRLLCCGCKNNNFEQIALKAPHYLRICTFTLNGRQERVCISSLVRRTNKTQYYCLNFEQTTLLAKLHYCHYSASRMWKKGKRTSPLVTWQQTRRAGGVIHQTDRLKTQTHVATLQGYPPRWHLSSSFGKFVTILDFFYVFGGVNAKSRWFLLRLWNFYLKIEFCMNDFAENLRLTSDQTCNAGNACFAGSRVRCQQSFEIVGIAMLIARLLQGVRSRQRSWFHRFVCVVNNRLKLLALQCQLLSTRNKRRIRTCETALGGHVERNEVQSKHPQERTHCEHRLCVTAHSLFSTRSLSRGSFDLRSG